MINTKKILATALSALLFISNGLLVHAAETNFWKERKEQLDLQLASLPQHRSISPIGASSQPFKETISPRLNSTLQAALAKNKSLALNTKIRDLIKSVPASAGSIRSISL